MSNELATLNPTMEMVMSANIEQVSQQLQAIDNFQLVVKNTLKQDQDYGVIPGTNKPTLLKPGAEKILMLMGLTSEYEIVDKVEDYQNGFFAYTVKSSLLKDGKLITEGFGSANTKETRYRLKEWSDEEHKKIWNGEYQDPFTLVNTVLKMAKKRAQVDSALTVGSLSNVFTQDVEDMRDFLQKEQVETMGTTDAENTKVTFGKHKGRTLGEIAKEDRSYLNWLIKNAQKDEMKKAAQMVLNPPKKAPVKSEPKAEKKEPKKVEKVEEKITPDQLAEIELTLDVVPERLNQSAEDFLIENKSTRYKTFNKDQAARFIEFLNKKLGAVEPDFDQNTAEDQQALFNDMKPPMADDIEETKLPFDI